MKKMPSDVDIYIAVSCDLVTLAEAKDETAYVRVLLQYGDIFSTETLVALCRGDAIKLVQ